MTMDCGASKQFFGSKKQDWAAYIQSYRRTALFSSCESRKSLVLMHPTRLTARGQYGNACVANASYLIPVNQFGVSTVYTLMNSAWGQIGSTIGSLVFTGALGETYTYNLVEGDNIRDHDGFNNSATNISGSASYGGGQVRLDMQTIVLPVAFDADTLVSVEFMAFGGYPEGDPFIAAISTTSATPIPATLPLFATALGGLGLLGWRRKRKQATA
jgi:hypothetical protein